MRFYFEGKNGAGNRADLSEKSFLKRRGLEGGWSIIKRFGECSMNCMSSPQKYMHGCVAPGRNIFSLFATVVAWWMGSWNWGFLP